MRLDLGLIIGLLTVIWCNGEEDSTERPGECVQGCKCAGRTLECSELELDRIPAEWPTHYEKITLRNCTITTLEKNSFRKFGALEELRIENCNKLDVIDKYAFKGLQKLKLLNIAGNPKLREIHRFAFSSIGNQNPLRILLKNNGIEKIHAYAFKNAHNLRELYIEDRCYTVEPNGLSSISRLDFFTLKGACVLSLNSFSNTSRVHSLSILDSTLNLFNGIFDQLSHVNQIQIRECRLGKLEENTFSGLFTVGSLQIQTSHIGRVSPRAFVGMENVGVLLISYTTIREPLGSPECLLHTAHKLVFSENTLHCSCEMQWIQFHKDQVILSENYCDRSEAFKALAYFKPLGCEPLTTKEPDPVPITSKPTVSEVFIPDGIRRTQYEAEISTAASDVCTFFCILVFLLLMNF
ncbi:unnamed protein product [Bursaphelenchus xylophilus]|uniref:(pine wood nematode) hypothetical protein n=1 Tax=Bursaphelenchus xylophilus TaxID=6326 RepID=A0A1I7SQ72_BURXY|nr:unnamed protein product [Bursaphelenchus xylophilus]CAG9109674.1 unnamed protein product [Bursaphelenchus xylophilus]